MKKRICKYIVFIIWALSSYALGQDVKTKSEKKPIKHSFSDAYIINSQTINTLRKNTLQFSIQHRFGNLSDGLGSGKTFDMFGILGVANVRIGLTFGLSNNLTVGIGATKNNHLYDIRWKYKILKQTKGNEIPVSIAYYGNTAIKSVYSKDMLFVNRLSYFHELIFARKFSRKLSLQIAPSVSYFNLVDTTGGQDIKHLNYALSVTGRYNVSPMGSIIFEYNNPFSVSTFSNNLKTKPNIGIGYEISTGGHVFQIFITNANSIIDQYNIVENTNNFFDGDVFIGFNISRNWSF